MRVSDTEVIIVHGKVSMSNSLPSLLLTVFVKENWRVFKAHQPFVSYIWYPFGISYLAGLYNYTYQNESSVEAGEKRKTLIRPHFI